MVEYELKRGMRVWINELTREQESELRTVLDAMNVPYKEKTEIYKAPVSRRRVLPSPDPRVMFAHDPEAVVDQVETIPVREVYISFPKPVAGLIDNALSRAFEHHPKCWGLTDPDNHHKSSRWHEGSCASRPTVGSESPMEGTTISDGNSGL